MLLVDDDAKVADSLGRALTDAGFEVVCCADGVSALTQLDVGVFDVVVLDLGLPDMSGFEVLAAARPQRVIVLSARPELDARLQAFREGAVDYVQKPFWAEELIARLRLHDPSPGDLVVSATDASLAGRRLALTGAELAVLRALVERPGRALRREQLADLALGDPTLSPRTVDSHVAHLRRKLGPDAGRVATVWGIGYAYRPGGEEGPA